MLPSNIPLRFELFLSYPASPVVALCSRHFVNTTLRYHLKLGAYQLREALLLQIMAEILANLVPANINGPQLPPFVHKRPDPNYFLPAMNKWTPETYLKSGTTKVIVVVANSN